MTYNRTQITILIFIAIIEILFCISFLLQIGNISLDRMIEIGLLVIGWGVLGIYLLFSFDTKKLKELETKK